jgi:hypothetical protein
VRLIIITAPGFSPVVLLMQVIGCTLFQSLAAASVWTTKVFASQLGFAWASTCANLTPALVAFKSMQEGLMGWPANKALAALPATII